MATPLSEAPVGDGAPDADSQRREFVKAFVANAAARPGAERVGVRPSTLVLISVLSAASALVVGVVIGLVSPKDEAGANPLAQPSAPAVSQVAGWDCAKASDYGLELVGQGPGWRVIPEGGWKADGCTGAFTSMPMSGSSTVDSPDRYAVWWFAVGSSMRQCEVSVYVPYRTDVLDAAGEPAQYYVLDGRQGTPYAAFAVTQTQQRGAWARGGTFEVMRGEIAVKLVDRGEPRQPGAGLAVAQVRAVCSG